MTYIVQRKDRFYVVAYDGLDPITGRERRRWHRAGRDRTDADALADRLDADVTPAAPRAGGSITVGSFLRDTWLPLKRRQARSTTAYRYGWFIDHYIVPAIGEVPLRRLRVDHLDAFYAELATTGGRHGTGLAPKTVLEVHMIVRAGLEAATERRLVDRNVAHGPHARLARSHPTIAQAWSAADLATFLAQARDQRRYPALDLAAHTGMRRGEVVGVRWSDLDVGSGRLSVQRSVQCVGGRPVELGPKTQTGRRCIDLDAGTIEVLSHWRRRLQRDGLPDGSGDWVFCNPAGRFLNPESLSQLFGRTVARAGVPVIRFHDLRHTHASLLVAAGVPIKVVSERLGHAHPGFTMRIYQHVMPGMSAAAAEQFATLVGAAEPVDVYRHLAGRSPGHDLGDANAGRSPR